MTLPNFDQIEIANIEPQLTELLDDNRQAIQALSNQSEPPNWASLMSPLEQLDDKLQQFWSPISHLHGVLDSPELREAYNKCLPHLSAYSTELGHNQALFHAIESLAGSEQFSSLNTAQQKIINNDLRDFKLAGVALPADKQKKHAELCQKLATLTTKFEENCLDATQAWHYHVTDSKQLAGIPKTAIAQAAHTAKQKKQDGWLFTLDIPAYLAVVTYADDRQFREAMYQAYCTRASDQGPNAGRFDNSNVMDEILNTRLELAKLLGFNNFAEYSLATKMVKDPQDVLAFLQELIDASRPHAQQEFQALSDFAREHLDLPELAAWDIAYASEKLRQHRYDISQETLRQYFPEEHVINGLFAIVQTLFGVHIKPVPDASVWHPDVRCFAMFDRNEQLISYFYFDLYARQNKRGGAWMDDLRGRRQGSDGKTQIPVAFLTCNFSAPVNGQAALLRHDEVVTLFHEFGHSLQHMLTQIDYLGVSGINGVPWDAVEIASQFLENWAWQETAIAKISSHHETHEPLPEDLFDRMKKAKNFQSAMQMVRQLEFALFDFRLHLEFDPNQNKQAQKILNDVRKTVSVIPTPNYNRFQHGFTHIFAGGYAAGYYSYKWAEIMAADAFSLFLERGIFDPETSKKFQNTFLAQGGAVEPMDLFIEFRGRKPSIQALLEQDGITNE